MNLEKLVRKNILSLKPYSCARNEFSGTATVWLDANENAYNNPYNRYPDPLQRRLKEKIAELRGVAANRIFLGVGSDECIDLTYRIFCRPGVDNVVAISPSYGMYEVCADINDVEYRKAPLTADFGLDKETVLRLTDDNTKVVWICSPNNPTGNAFDRDDIADICTRFGGIVVVDEAYIDFSSKGSMLEMLDSFPNLIVMQTFSKAWGSAAARLGMAFASKEIIDIFNKVKYPYNINLLTQNYALELLDRYGDIREWVRTLIAARDNLIGRLSELDCVEKIYPTDANFVLVKVTDANAIYRYLCDCGIVVRNRNSVEMCLNCLRITAGTEGENDQLIQTLAQYGK